MNEAKVEIVRDKKGVRDFVTFPFALYRDDPNWVPPFIEERVDFLDRHKNPFFEHARCELFMARREGKIVGTIAAVVDDFHNQLYNERLAAFGFFECIDDAQVAACLLQAAERWAIQQGMTVVRGPLSLSTNQECGLLIEGFDTPPMIMMTHNPRYYARLIEANGYAKAMDLFAYIGDLDDRLKNAPPKFFRVAHKAIERQKIRIRKADARRFAQELELFRQVYQRAWNQNWGFVPLTNKEINYLAANFKQWLDPHLILIAENELNEPVGVSIAMPDLHQALKWSGGGHLFPFGALKFLWYSRRINQARLFAMGVVEEYRGIGIDAVFYVETARAALARGYKRMEGSWVLESNTMMNRISERVGGERYKTYRIYEKALSALQ